MYLGFKNTTIFIAFAFFLFALFKADYALALVFIAIMALSR